MFYLAEISKYSFKFENPSVVTETLHIMSPPPQEFGENSFYVYGASKKILKAVKYSTKCILIDIFELYV
jgi:hypothetical protein